LYQHTKPSSKKQQIWKLVEAGKLSPTQIAFQVGTTVKNVWKETSNFRKNEGNTINESRTLEQRTKQKDEVIFVKASQEFQDARDIDIIGHMPNSNVTGNKHYNKNLALPEMDAESFKVLYKGFKLQMKPVDMIAKRGFHPEIVVAEYQRFMQLTQTDYDDLLRQIIIKVVDHCSYKNEKIKVIVDTYKSRGILTAIEVIRLLELWVETELKSRLDLLFADPESRIPEPLRRWRCSKCNSQLPDGIINPNWRFGKYILEKYSKKIVCGFCLVDTR
jgi:hypothetical protein